MRHDVVNVGRRHNAAALLAYDTERVSGKVSPAHLAPASIVPTIGRRLAPRLRLSTLCARMERAPTVIGERRASWIRAWSLCSKWQMAETRNGDTRNSGVECECRREAGCLVRVYCYAMAVALLLR